ncbi:hypothetical protein MY494_04315 [Synechococcus sp. A10-1-5-1]|uniref:hypothetical protein n=1 Tax=Synechococcus sp. A10-1-5-1 TaxID=2936507 RepID=UPI002000A18E|nr:hypothetical protein [Synechococcus sp. A10-1-5-1]UPM51005.1 hypothetical protein MY494_04315 [Synechococcus sp. A10-1-5-1]
MALDPFKQALAALLEQAPEDPLERDEYFELNTLPSYGGSGFEVVICDEEHEIFAVIYTDRLFEEGEEGQEAVEALVPGFLEAAYNLTPEEWKSTEPFDLGWRSREYLWFMEFTVPGLKPTCSF